MWDPRPPHFPVTHAFWYALIYLHPTLQVEFSWPNGWFPITKVGSWVGRGSSARWKFHKLGKTYLFHPECCNSSLMERFLVRHWQLDFIAEIEIKCVKLSWILLEFNKICRWNEVKILYEVFFYAEELNLCYTFRQWVSLPHWLWSRQASGCSVSRTIVGNQVGIKFRSSTPKSVKWSFSYPEIGDSSFRCALWTFKQQLTWKVWARCGISIVLL